MKRKLLIIVNVDWFFLSHRLPIAIAAMEQGYEVHLACGVTNKRTVIERYGIKVHPLRLSRSGFSLYSEIGLIWQLFTIVKMVGPSVLHTVTIKPVLYGMLCGRILGVRRRIAAISGLGYVFIANDLRARALRFFVLGLYRAALRDEAVVVFQNSSDLKLIQSTCDLKPEQCVLIHGSGVNLDEYCAKAEDKSGQVVMLIARLLFDKGVCEFVGAAKLVKGMLPNAKFVLVGDIDPENPKSITQEMLASWVANGDIEHWGYSEDIPSVIAGANLIVLPSYREGLPRVLIEAAACQRAIITTDVPGCRDAIIPNITGVLVPPKTTQPLAESIEDLLVDIVKRETLAINGRRLAETKFDIATVVEKHLALYEGAA